MKEQLKRLWKEHRKPMIAVFVLSLLVVGTLIYNSLDSKGNSEKVLADTDTAGEQMEEATPTSLEELAAETEEATVVDEKATKEEAGEQEEPTEMEFIVAGNPTAKPAMENKSTTKSETKASDAMQATDQEKTAGKQVSEPAMVPSTETVTEPVQPSPTPTVVPVQENQYVPISEGWKDSRSAKGDITAAQKADLDSMIKSWKDGAVSDAELKNRIMKYLDEQGIAYMEVSVTSKGYALYDVIPEIELRDGGNLYSFVGMYSTGKQNPDGTDKTVCYNWSAFVF